MSARLVTVAGQPSWVLASDQVELAVTQLGGHMAPVRFYRSTGREIQPYYLSPWQEEKPTIAEPVLVPLRGDFFCLPFGARCRHKAVTYPTHGEPAGRCWQLLEARTAGPVSSLALTMRTRHPAGRITKRLALRRGHNAVYLQHTLEGFTGRFSLGHHATLAMPARQHSVHLATSAYRFGMTNPVPPADPAQGSYSCLAVNRRFADLRRVPTIWRDPAVADCTCFPTRKGFCDQLAVFHKPSRRPVWTTATFEDEGFLWFSLKDAAVLPALMIWVENHGRYVEPWSGRNRCLGLEDVCGFLAEGLSASRAPNPVAKAGVPTTVALWPRRPTVINHIQGVARVPAGFRKVKAVTFAPGRVTFVSTAGKRVSVPLAHEFLAGEPLEG